MNAAGERVARCCWPQTWMLFPGLSMSDPARRRPRDPPAEACSTYTRLSSTPQPSPSFSHTRQTRCSASSSGSASRRCFARREGSGRRRRCRLHHARGDSRRRSERSWWKATPTPSASTGCCRTRLHQQTCWVMGLRTLGSPSWSARLRAPAAAGPHGQKHRTNAAGSERVQRLPWR